MRGNRERYHKGMCPVWRVVEIRKGTLNIDTGEVKMNPSRTETVLQQCCVPLFDRDAKICSSCASGWETEKNALATGAILREHGIDPATEDITAYFK